MLSTRFLTVSAAAFLALGLAACGGGSSDSSSGSAGSKEPLKIGTEGVYAPFTFHDETSNKLTGYDVEVTEAVAAKLGRKVEFSETSWDSIFAGLEAKRYDVIANQVSITSERQAKYSFSQPYTFSSGVIVTRADDTSVSSVADLKGKKAAQSATSTFGEAATAAGAKVEPVEGLTQSLALVKQKRVDLTLNDSLSILDYQKKTGDQGIKIAGSFGDPTQQAFVFRKDSDLAPEFNKALDELRSDGTLTKLSEKYFGKDVSSASTDEAATASPSAS